MIVFRYVTLLFVCLMLGITLNAQVYLLQEDFSSLTAGTNITTDGPSTVEWNGNENFPYTSCVFSAGGMLKMGCQYKGGTLITKNLDLSVNGGNFTISFGVKGWSTVEGKIKISVIGLANKYIAYSTTIDSPTLENKVVTFAGGTAYSTITFETTSRRAFIDNINIYYNYPCVNSNLSFEKSTVDLNMGLSNVIILPNSLDNVTPIKYTSSNHNIAGIDENTGELYLNEVGSTVISATQSPIQNENLPYCQSTATYILNVFNKPTMCIQESVTADLYAPIGDSDNMTFNVEGKNLTTDILLPLSGPDANQFDISQSSIIEQNGIADNTVVKVIYSPISTGVHTANIVIRSTGVDDVVLQIKGSSLITNSSESQGYLKVIASNGLIRFKSTSGLAVQIYNSVGQKLWQDTTIDGYNSFRISEKGVVLLKIGTQFYKVIL